MSDSLNRSFDATRILLDLQKSNEIAQSFSACLEPEEIARRTTDGIVAKFNCALARLWLLDSSQITLKLVASSGLYTSINGSFSQVPMGAYKVGKIAQNRVAFLSNNLAAESWVGNRQWAIDNKIRGFAGYPLAIKERVIGVLATFSYQELEPEFLEALQTLCSMVTIALDTALHCQKEKQNWQFLVTSPLKSPLSDQLASLLPTARLILVGTEHPLSLSITYVFLKIGEILHNLGCIYCRLIYQEDQLSLEAIVPISSESESESWLNTNLGQVLSIVSCLGGILEGKNTTEQQVIQVLLSLPYVHSVNKQFLRIHCSFPVLQIAFTQLAFWAGLQVCQQKQEDIPLLTDYLEDIPTAKYILWLPTKNKVTPKGIGAKIDLSITPEELKQAVKTVISGQVWGLSSEELPSERELEILLLLTEGLRDREIAKQLIISESTVKFHINNLLKKLKVKTRYQAVHQAIKKGWLD